MYTHYVYGILYGRFYDFCTCDKWLSNWTKNRILFFVCVGLISNAFDWKFQIRLPPISLFVSFFSALAHAYTYE